MLHSDRDKLRFGPYWMPNCKFGGLLRYVLQGKERVADNLHDKHEKFKRNAFRREGLNPLMAEERTRISLFHHTNSFRRCPDRLDEFFAHRFDCRNGRLLFLRLLVEILLQRTGELQEHTVKGGGSEAMNALTSHGWSGNLRELVDVVRNACRRTKWDRIELGDLLFPFKQGTLPAERRLPLDTLLEQVERRLIALALKLTQTIRPAQRSF